MNKASIIVAGFVGAVLFNLWYVAIPEAEDNLVLEEQAERYSSNFSKPALSLAWYETSVRWGQYPVYELRPNPALPESFDVKTVTSKACKHFLKKTSYSYGTYDSISAFGMSWTEYNGQWITFSRFRHEHVGHGRRSIPPGYYPFCGAGSNTDSQMFKIYIGDYESLVRQHKIEKGSYESKEASEEQALQEEIEKVNL